MKKQKRILITGANGFIGSHIAEKALGLGYEIVAGVRENSDCKYLPHNDIKLVNLAYDKKEVLVSQLNNLGKFDYIIHNAGVTKCLDKNDFEKINFQNTANLLEALKQSSTIPDKFILMSSLSVMGTGDELNFTPFMLRNTPNPNTAYGKSKLKAEYYLRKQADIPYLIFRPTGVYGPRERDYLMMINTVKSGLTVSAGFKPQHLTFIYVKDLVDIIFKGIESKVVNHIYFVSDGDVYTDKEYTCLIKEVLNKKNVLSLKIPLWLVKVVSIISEELSKISKKPSTLNRDKYIIMKQRNWECDIQPLINDFGFSPRYNLKAGLKESIEWYKENGWI